MDRRSQRESFLLGFLIAGLMSLAAVILISQLPLFSTESAETMPAAIGATETTGEPSTGLGGPPRGHGPGGARANPLASGTAAIEVREAFDAGGCVACHVIKGVGGENASIGPPLMRTGAIAAERRPGATPEAYIEASILNPDAFIMPNCPTGPCPSGVMPQTYGESLSEDQVETIVDYLSALGTPEESAVLFSP